MSSLGSASRIGAPVLAAAAGIAGAAIGISLTGLRKRAQIAVPFSAGVMLGVALFGLAPELAREMGWVTTALLWAAGYGVLFFINRFVYPVCPSCSHDHDHNACLTELHGFAAPLIAAATVHAFFDGWSIATVEMAATVRLQVAVPLAVTLHKVPEGIALGGVLRASVRSRAMAAGWAIAAEGATLAGGALGLFLGPRIGSAWITYPLGIAAGWLSYLGYHALHEESKRRGVRAALAGALAGVVGAAVVLQGMEAWLR